MLQKTRIGEIISEAILVKTLLLEDEAITATISSITEVIKTAYRHDHKVLFCGNGGSAADAQHLASELSARFYLDRRPLDAEALHVNTSYLTATANDFSFDEVYARLVQAKGRKGDILVGLSTSGNSHNVVKALQTAKSMGVITIGMTGSLEGNMDQYCDYLVKIPSINTPRIQEAQMLLGHIICELVEKELFGGKE